mgnify:FL=1
MKKKSVIMIVAKYPATHGHTSVINNLCLELKNLGYRTAIGSFDFKKDPPKGVEKIKLYKLKLLFSGISYLDFDIIHSHQTQINYFLMTRRSIKPIFFHYHGASNKIQEINFKISMFLHRKKFSKILSVSNAGITQMKKLNKEISAVVLYNGVNTNFYHPELPTPFKKGDPQLLFVSALRSYKKTKFLVNSMHTILKKLPKAHLQIVGDGEDLLELKSMIKKQNLEKYVELTGKITDDDLRLRYSSCDLYISASTFEVCPVPTLEAMACGKPLVLYGIEPHKEIIDNSKAGMIFFKHSASELCEKIEQSLSQKSIFSNLAIDFAQKVSWSNICKQLSTIYESF